MAYYYHRSEIAYNYGGLPLRYYMNVFRCEKHTVKPYHETREPATDE